MSEAEERELQQIRNQIAFGLDMKVFMASPIGRYLAARANSDRDRALEELATVDPHDPKAVQTLQNKIAVAANFLTWVGEAVTDGENAEGVFIEASN